MYWGHDRGRRRDKEEVGNRSDVLIEVSWFGSDRKGHVSQGTKETSRNVTQ